MREVKPIEFEVKTMEIGRRLTWMGISAEQVKRDAEWEGHVVLSVFPYEGCEKR